MPAVLDPGARARPRRHLPPESELTSHCFEATLPRQFDECVWFDETPAITPLAGPTDTAEPPETYPFGS
ncbi:MAG TPA: hypothetical protein VNK43_01110 [Gemmatimonadales bacterium]|nr:hypothetical protein [Gemmatimonadales bacterium]